MSAMPVAVITGAAGGLGQVIARTLRSDGFRLALVDRDEQGLDRLRGELSAGERVQHLVGDISLSADVSSIVAAVRARWGRTDALVNNAGIEPALSFASFDASAWDRTFAVNVRAAALLVAGFRPLWQRQGSGAVVFIGSRTAASGSSTPAYCASKAALIGLSASVAVELGPTGVTSNVVSPSFVRTPLNASKGDAAAQEAFAVRFAELSPLERLIEPQDVASAVAYLVSARARNITGEVLNVAAGTQLPPTLRPVP